MDDRESGGDLRHTCPYLGLASDPSLRCSFLTSSHRCFRWPTPQPVDFQQQRSYCLSADFEDCSWFVSVPSGPPDRCGVPFRTGQVALLGVVTAVVLVAALLFYFKPWSLLFPATDSSRSGLVAEPTAPATPAPLFPTYPSPVVPTPTPQPPAPTPSGGEGAAPAATVPSATVAPAPASPTSVRSTSSPAAAASVGSPSGPTATPAATPPGVSGSAAVRVYTVKEGDNLYTLARTFGVTVDALVKANNLPDRSTLRVGQTLVIPPPSQ